MIILRYWIPILTILVVVSTIPFVSTYDFTENDFAIPSWIKNTAGWWADDQIDDSSFVTGLQWMISNDVIILPLTGQGTGDGENSIPSWVKQTASWWADGEIYDDTFVAALQYLIVEGIIIVEQEVEEVEEVEESTENTVELKEFHMVVNGQSCFECVSWAHVGDEYYFQIETFDEYRGNHIDGVTLTAEIFSKDGELRHDFGYMTTEDGIFKTSVAIPNMDWFAENTLSITGEYNGIEKTIEKEFQVFSGTNRSSGQSGCGALNPFSLSNEETMPNGIVFNTGGNHTNSIAAANGTKIFIVGSDGDEVNEYRTSIPYCLNSATLTQTLDISNKETMPQSIAFNPAGTKMFIVGDQGDDITEYTLTIGFNISTATYSSGDNECDLTANSSGITAPRAVDFSPNGLQMLVISSNTDEVDEYALSTAFDVSTCSWQGTSHDFDTSGKDGAPRGMAFSQNGKYMFFVGKTTDCVYSYTLGKAFDPATAVYVEHKCFSVAGDEDIPTGLAFSWNGKKMFIVGQEGKDITPYNLRIAWNVTTAVGPNPVISSHIQDCTTSTQC